MKKSFLILLSLMTIAATQSGCIDQKDINDVSMVLSMGIDKSNDKFKVTVQIPIAVGKGDNGGKKEMYFLEFNTGRSVQEALQKIQQASRILRFSHQQVLIIQEDIAKKNIREVLDFFNRNRESNLTTYIYISKRKAFDILNTHPELDGISGEAISRMGRLMGFGITTREFLGDLYKEGKDPIAYVVDIERDKPVIKRVAIFKEDKMKFITDENQGLGVQWMKRNAMKGKSITFLSKNGKLVTVNVTSQSFKIIPVVTSNTPRFNIKISGKGFIGESEEVFNVQDKIIMNQLESSLESNIKKQINDLLKKTLENGIDTLGFGHYLYVYKNVQWEKEWKVQWDQMLSNIKIDIDVKFVIENTGLNIHSLIQ